MPSACANTRSLSDHIHPTRVAGDFPERVAATIRAINFSLGERLSPSESRGRHARSRRSCGGRSDNSSYGGHSFNSIRNVRRVPAPRGR